MSEIHSSRSRHPWEIPHAVKLEVIRLYESGQGTPEIGRAVGFSTASVYRCLVRSGVKTRNRSQAKRTAFPLREDAFDIITEESAYWIGFLMADGCIAASRGTRYIAIGLKLGDEPHLRKFLSFVGSSNIVTHAKGTVRIGVHSDQMIDTLARYGVVPRKSKVAEVFHLEMNRHFWRGVVDGDGSLFINGRGMPTFSLCGSKRLVDQFAEYAATVAPDCKAKVHSTKAIFAFTACGSHAYRLAGALYDDCSIALDRKLESARQILSREDPFVNRSLKWGNITPETLDALYAQIGSWNGVADHLEIPVSSLSCIRLRLGHRGRRKPKASPE